MRTIFLLTLVLGTYIYVFSYNFEIKDCSMVNPDGIPLIVCPNKQLSAVYGYYRTGPDMIVLHDYSETTIDHECLHFTLEKYKNENIQDIEIQHKIIDLHQKCNENIKNLINKL